MTGVLRRSLEVRLGVGEYEGIHFRGPLDLSETARAMGGAAYSIVPSLWEEPFGAVALESVAAGCIVIHSDRGGLPEAVGPLGFSFDPDDPATLISTLRRAREFRDALLSSNSAEAAYKADVKAHIAQFSPDRVVAKIVDVMTSQRGPKHIG